MKRFRLGVRLGDRRPLIALAALNPQMLRLGGELADAVLLNYLPSSYVAESVSEIRKGGDAKIFAYVHAAVSDFDEFVESARRDLFGYAVADGYARMFTAAGFGEEVAELRARHKDRDREGAVAAISEAMVQAINFIGSSDEVFLLCRCLRRGRSRPIDPHGDAMGVRQASGCAGDDGSRHRLTPRT